MGFIINLLPRQSLLMRHRSGYYNTLKKLALHQLHIALHKHHRQSLLVTGQASVVNQGVTQPLLPDPKWKFHIGFFDNFHMFFP